MPLQPDIVVYSADHQLQLVVEIKSMSHSDAQWAADLRRNLLNYHAVPPSPFFLLVLTDRLYLWSPEQADASALPGYEVTTKSVLGKYLPDQAKNGTLGGLSLELAVNSWLSDLATPDPASHIGNPDQQWLSDSGLADAVQKGTIRVEALA